MPGSPVRNKMQELRTTTIIQNRKALCVKTHGAFLKLSGNIYKIAGEDSILSCLHKKIRLELALQTDCDSPCTLSNQSPIDCFYDSTGFEFFQH